MDRKDASALASADALSQLALAATGDAVVTVDPAGVITSWNAGAESLLGYGEAEAVGQTLALIVSPAHRPRHVAAFHVAMASGLLEHGGVPARVEVTRRDGRTVPLAMSLGVMIDSTGLVAGAVAVLREAGRPLVPFIPE